VWRRVIVLAALAAPLAIQPAVASAGTYRVYSCVSPSGAAAPVGDSSYGWQASARPGTNFVFLTDECAAGHGINARLAAPSAQPRGAGGQWTFRPPPGTSIAAFDVTWSGTAASGGETTISRSDQPDPVYERRYGSPFPPSGSSRATSTSATCSSSSPAPSRTPARPAPTSVPTASPRRR
jgi:hypothetical protein